MNKRKAIIIALAAAIVLTLSGVQIYRLVMRAQAEQMIERGDYEGARAVFERYGSESDTARCDALMLERTYQEALRLLETGDYASAEQIFEQISDYKDAKDRLSDCDMLRAKALTEEGRLIEARKVYLSLGDYPGCAQALDELNELMYARAYELASGFEMQEASELWQALGSYRDSPLLLERARRIIDWGARTGADRLTDASKAFTLNGKPMKFDTADVYANDACYIVVPKDCGTDMTFFLYYPGGRNEEISVDFLLYYLMNPSDNTIAVFLRKNGLDDMGKKCNEGIELLERAAAENGFFVREIVQGGSSLGAYPAMHGVIYAYENYRIETSCVLSLDAGSDWLEVPLLLTEEECAKTAALGVPFYLFESPWVGMNREGIVRMVNAGNEVIMVGCTFDDHTRITLDAMGMGVVKWATGDRSEPVNPEIYTFTRLEPEKQAA